MGQGNRPKARVHGLNRLERACIPACQPPIWFGHWGQCGRAPRRGKKMRVQYIPETAAEHALIERYEYLKKVRNMPMDWDEWLLYIGVTITPK